MYKGEWTIGDFDPEVAEAISQEEQRQEENIELIASENYASPRVMEAQGSLLTNKYAEGYPGRRYYGGCEHVDTVERLAIERACKLFGADYANVQPHSGSQANAAVYMALLQPGDTVLGMSLAEGGHLTHGSPVNFSGRLYNIVSYGLDENGLIDYENVAALAEQHPAQDDHCRFFGILTYRRLAALSGYCRFSWRLLLCRHGSCSRTRRGRRIPESRADRRCYDHNDAQDASRTARRHDSRQGK